MIQIVGERGRSRDVALLWATQRAEDSEVIDSEIADGATHAEADDELTAREPQAEAFGDEAAHLAAWDDEAGRFEDLKTAGAIVVQEHGCGFSTLLALTGPLADTVWWDGRATCDQIVPLSLDHIGGARPVRFSEWIEHGSWALLPPDWGRPPSPPAPVVPLAADPFPRDRLRGLARRLRVRRPR
ncbi:hypothetical protein OHB05_40645 [Streptomyces sp. NBC_00638]|uniref:hypothetical protein n=1 Tax=unclassified Streptomyces TaxID=2593676 RepID=UPI00224FCA69|nr:hypothetical protein [Streptomyces sp. NBC_00638]MCX5008836.1 hypothetical protein [Streptomyces sp. NBC_00638]